MLGTSSVGIAGKERSGKEGSDGITGTESVGSNVGSELKKEAKPSGENDGNAVIDGIAKSGSETTGGGEKGSLGIL
jgi:hypothetical protein